MRTKEDVLEAITGVTLTDKIIMPKGWIYQAMEQYAGEVAIAFSDFILTNVFQKLYGTDVWESPLYKGQFNTAKLYWLFLSESLKQ